MEDLPENGTEENEDMNLDMDNSNEPIPEGAEIEQEAMPDELTLLKQRAKMMGIKYHPSIGLDKLKTKIKDFQDTAKKANIKEAREALRVQEAKEAVIAPEVKLTPDTPMPETKSQKRARMVKEAGKLVRIRVSNMNPNKKEWEGDIYTVSNSVVGTFKKYIPYNNEEGWHVPTIILSHLQERMCQVFYTVKNSRGAKVRKGKLIKELSIEILPDLNITELKDLATRQAMAHSID